jgi:hypothetical protein
MEQFEKFLQDIRPLPDTPVSEVLGLIARSPELADLTGSCRARGTLQGDEHLNVRVVYRADLQDVSPKMPWKTAQELINRKVVVITIDDKSGGSPVHSPAPALVG